MYGINKELKEKYNLEVKQEGHKLSVNAASKDLNNDDINCVIEVGHVCCSLVYKWVISRLLYLSIYINCIYFYYYSEKLLYFICQIIRKYYTEKLDTSYKTEHPSKMAKYIYSGVYFYEIFLKAILTYL